MIEIQFVIELKEMPALDLLEPVGMTQEQALKLMEAGKIDLIQVVSQFGLRDGANLDEVLEALDVA